MDEKNEKPEKTKKMETGNNEKLKNPLIPKSPNQIFHKERPMVEKQ